MKLLILASCLFMLSSAQYRRGGFGPGIGYGRGYGGRGYPQGYGGYGAYGGYGGGAVDPGYGGGAVDPGYGHPGVGPAIGVPGEFLPPHHHRGFRYGHPGVAGTGAVGTGVAGTGVAGTGAVGDGVGNRRAGGAATDADTETVAVGPGAGAYDPFNYGNPGYYPRGLGGFQGYPGAGYDERGVGYGGRGAGAGRRGAGAGGRGAGAGTGVNTGVASAGGTAAAGVDQGSGAVAGVAGDAGTSGAITLNARKANTEVNEVGGLTGADSRPIKDVIVGGVDDRVVELRRNERYGEDARSLWVDRE